MNPRSGAPNRIAGALAAVAIAVAVFAPFLPSGSAAPLPDAAEASAAASTWLAGKSTDGAVSGFGGVDWGLTADTVFAHAAGGHGATAGAAATDQLAAHVADFASTPGGTSRSAGGLAKLLVVAAVAGRDASNFGGWNLRGELLDVMVTTPGDDLGRFRSVGQGDTSNGFTQSLAIIGLARTGTVPSDAVGHLLRQQCPSGGFRLFLAGSTSCADDQLADPDTTALAVQALAAAGAAGVAGTEGPASDGLDWLEVMQGVDGSLPGSGPTAGVANANSTGLAAQALRAGGRLDAADKASAYVRSLQIDCDLPALGAEVGAIAYNADALAATVETGSITQLYADQFVRTTALATLGLGAPSLAVLSNAGAPAGPGFDCDAPPTSSTSSTTAVPGSTSSTTSTTPAPAVTSTTSTTAPRTVTSTSTTVAVSVSATSSSDGTGVAVGGVTQVASGSARTTGTSSSGAASGLASTGTDIARLLALGIGLAALGAFLLEARRYRDA